jgi:ABC-type branched-subunit amino acid transport system permease subunit
LLIYGICLMVIVMFRPSGLWPWLYRWLFERRDGERQP